MSRLDKITYEEHIMKTIFSTVLLVLVLPWKLNGDITLSPNAFNQDEGTSESHKFSSITEGSTTVLQVQDEYTTLTTDPHIKYPNALDGTSVEISHGGALPINSTTVEAIFLLNSSTKTKGSSTATEKKGMKTRHKIATRDIATNAETDISPSKQDSDKHATESTTQNAISSSKLPSEFISVMTHAKGQTTIERFSTEKSRSSSHLFSQGPLGGRMKENLLQHNQTKSKETPKEASRMLVKHQILHTLPQIHTNSTDTKGPTKSPSEVVTKEVEKVLVHPLTIIQTTEHSSENQENEGIKATTLARNHSDVMSLDNSAQTYNPARISSSKMGVTLPQTHPTNQTAPSSGLISTVNTEILTTTATNNEITTGKQDTGGMTREGKTSTTQPGKTHATKPKEGNIMQPTKAETSKPPGTQNKGEARTKQGRHKGSKSNPGPIVASVITGVLVLMLIMIVMILVRNHRRKKKQIINSDWAGPSPFLEGSIEPNLPSEPFHQNKSKRISLHSFLPQQLSNRLAMLPEDDLHMVDVSGGCTFGRNVEDDVLAEAGKAEMEKEQIQTHHTDQSQPAASPPSDIPAAETANTPTAPAISLSIQQTPHSDETIPFTPLGNTTVAPPHFEDVDLDRALEPTAESETLPTPPPPPPPPQSQ